MTKGVGVNKDFFGETSGNLLKPGLTAEALAKIEASGNPLGDGPDPFGDVFSEKRSVEASGGGGGAGAGGGGPINPMKRGPLPDQDQLFSGRMGEGARPRSRSPPRAQPCPQVRAPLPPQDQMFGGGGPPPPAYPQAPPMGMGQQGGFPGGGCPAPMGGPGQMSGFPGRPPFPQGGPGYPGMPCGAPGHPGMPPMGFGGMVGQPGMPPHGMTGQQNHLGPPPGYPGQAGMFPGARPGFGMPGMQSGIGQMGVPQQQGMPQHQGMGMPQYPGPGMNMQQQQHPGQ